ncbi:MAG TPA: DNA polymerase III subunit epsilon, partial [Microbacterium sp.]|nr:DNA polymerase III subunit epsilon [Microbacterium sp.]
TAGWLIRPPFPHDRFFEINTRIHGIREQDVVDAPTWAEQLPDLCAFIGDDVAIAHNAGFDMSVIRRACEATGTACPDLTYACTVQVSRRTYDIPSHRLPAAAAAAGYAGFVHHEAVADAVACAHIAIDAARRAAAPDITSLAEALGVRLGRLEGFAAAAETIFA